MIRDVFDLAWRSAVILTVGFWVTIATVKGGEYLGILQDGPEEVTAGEVAGVKWRIVEPSECQ